MESNHAGSGLLPVELCLAASWAECGDLIYTRMLTLPRIGESLELPNRAHAVFRVVDVRHVPATPGGGAARIRIRIEAQG